MALGEGAAGVTTTAVVHWCPGVRLGAALDISARRGLLRPMEGAFKNPHAQTLPLETVLSGSRVGPDISIC